MPQISVIIPFYNGEKYIRSIANSMISQTFKDIEIIFVDDGSVDNSGKLVDEYVKQDTRVKYIYQENAGGGIARNTGISAAQGNYVICLDVDDNYDYDLLEKLYLQADKTDADITVCNYKRLDVSTGRIANNKGINKKMLPCKEVFSSADVDDILRLITPYPCNKLYKLSFIQNNNLKYSGTKIINDLKFCMVAFILAKKITTVDDSLITYRYQCEGSGSGHREKHIYASFKVFKEIYDEFCDRNIFENNKKTYFQRIFDTLNYELSFPVQDYVIDKIKDFLYEPQFSELSKEEMQKLLSLPKMRKNEFEYYILKMLTLGLNQSINNKEESAQRRLKNISKLDINYRYAEKGVDYVVKHLKKFHYNKTEK